VEILATWIREEEDPRVMQPLFDAAAKIQDPAISKAVRERLSGDLPHFARKAGLMALGVQRDEDAAAELQQAARREAWGGWAQGGAFLGLAKLRDEAATQELMARTEPGATPEDCRFGAVLALGQIGRLQSEAIREDVADHLIRLLRDDHQRVRRHAMLGLKELGHKRALGPLESFRQSVSAQERVEIQRAIDAIRAGAKPADKELRSELEKLQSKVRQLENDLRKVQRSLDD
jgi:HEAT repeat protein